MAGSHLDLRLGREAPGATPGRVARTLQNVLAVVFCLPFLGFGLLAVNEGVNRLAAGDWGQAAPLLILGLVFTLVPVALLLVLKHGRRKLAQAEARRARHPDEPWLWNPAWAEGRILDSSRSGVIVAWLFAGVWNAISWTLALRLPADPGREASEVGIALLFALIGLALLVWAVRATLRWRRFGSSVFQMTTLPGVLGGELSGRLRAGDGLFAAREFRLSLSCIRRYVTGSGKSRSTHEDVLWTEDATLSPSALVRGPRGIELPVEFALPYDCRPSDPIESDDRILWRLRVVADVPGIDYAARFELPVFATSRSDPQRTRAALARERGAARPLPVGPLPSGILVRPHPQGGSEIVFPAGRMRGLALGVTLAAALLLGASAVCFQSGEPIHFGAVLGVLAALAGGAALRLWRRSLRVVVRNEAVEIEVRLPPFRRKKRVSASEIGDVDLAIGMRVGRRSYWDLWLRPPDAAGRPAWTRSGTRIAARIADKGEAELLLAVIHAALGKGEVGPYAPAPGGSRRE